MLVIETFDNGYTLKTDDSNMVFTTLKELLQEIALILDGDFRATVTFTGATDE